MFIRHHISKHQANCILPFVTSFSDVFFSFWLQPTCSSKPDSTSILQCIGFFNKVQSSAYALHMSRHFHFSGSMSKLEVNHAQHSKIFNTPFWFNIFKTFLSSKKEETINNEHLSFHAKKGWISQMLQIISKTEDSQLF